MRIRAPTLLIAFTCATACVTQPRVSTSPSVIWAGVFKVVEKGAEVERLESPTGTAYSYVVAERLKSTSDIQMELGTLFGLTYNWKDASERARAHTVVWRFPPGGLVNPETGETIIEYRQRKKNCTGSRGCHTGWSLDEPWELVPGPWTVEIYAGDSLLLVHTFNLRAR